MLTTVLTTISLDTEITLPRAKVSHDGSYMSTKANYFNLFYDSKEDQFLCMYYSFDVVVINNLHLKWKQRIWSQYLTLLLYSTFASLVKHQRVQGWI